MYKVTLGNVRVTIVAVETQVLTITDVFCILVLSIRYAKRNFSAWYFHL